MGASLLALAESIYYSIQELSFYVFVFINNGQVFLWQVKWILPQTSGRKILTIKESNQIISCLPRISSNGDDRIGSKFKAQKKP